MMMRPPTVGPVLGWEREDWYRIEPGWSESLATWDGMTPDFMCAEMAAEALALTGFPERLDNEFRRVEQLTRKTPAAQFYAWHWYRTALLSDCPLPGDVPEPTGVYGELGGVFHLMIALGAVPLIRESYRKLGIPDVYALAAVQWIAGTIGLYRAAHGGVPGHTAEQTSWLRFHINGKLFRIGRLEYLVHSYPDWVPAVFRHRGDGRMAALARDGWCFDAAGWRLADDAAEGVAAKAHLTQLPDRFEGIPIDPATGRALPSARRVLPRSEWEPAVSACEWVPSIHIPGGGGMTPEAVRDSLMEAREFFRRYFDKELTLTVCGSWIFNPNFEEALPDSNVAAFQREVYLFPMVSSGSDGLFFVFGCRSVDWEQRDCCSRLEKAFREWDNDGVPLRTGGMFFAFADLPHWGRQHYRA